MSFFLPKFIVLAVKTDNMSKFINSFKMNNNRTSLAVQWLRCHTSIAEEVGLNPGRGNKSSYAMHVA